MNGKFRWLYPMFWGLLILATIRLAGDLSSHLLFWTRPIHITISELLFGISFGYLLDFLARKQLAYIEKKELAGKHIRKLIEYTVWILILTVLIMIGVYVLHEYAHYEHDVTSYAQAIMMTILCGISMYVAIRNTLIDERVKKQEMQLAKVKSENLNTQLQLLKSQYHPHFLFNALNTIYFQIEEDNDEARQTIQTLSNLLRYQLYTIDEKVDIEQEIGYITSYINLMKKRKSERMVLNTQFDKTLTGRKIYPLLFQPLIENAFKYVGGENPYINISLSKESNGLLFCVSNSIPEQNNSSKKGSGIGIENLRKRLELLYPQQYNLQINKEKFVFSVRLKVTIK